MRKRVCLALAAMLVLLSGCSRRPAEEPGLQLWFAGDAEHWSSTTTAVATVTCTGEESTVDGLMAALLAGPPADSGLISPIPAGTRLLGWHLEDGLLQIDLSGEYGRLTGIDLTLADYCITLTLSQLPQVERVSITVNGRPLSGRYRQELSGEQVIFSGAEEKPVEVTETLYFPRAAGRGLGVESRTFQLTEGEVPAEIVTQALLAGPETEELSPVIPEGTRLNALRLEDGVCTVDFSEEFLTGMPEEEELQIQVIYSIVDTLGNLDSVRSVCIQVEGETLPAYGSVVLPGPLEPDFGLTDSD